MNNNSNQENDSPGKPFRPLFIWILVGTAIISLLAFSKHPFGMRSEEISFSLLRQKIEEGGVKEIVIERGSGSIRGEYQTTGEKSGGATHFTSSGNPESISRNLEPILDERGVVYKYEPPSILREIIPILVYAAVFGLLFYFLVFRQMRGAGGGGILSFGKSKAVRISKHKNRKTFEDVAGIDEAREEVREIIEFLRSPEKFQRLGGRLPKGALLIGSPGTGKTLLAKAIAGEADVPFFSISGSDFVEMFVGVGASRVRDLFEQAKANSPCIIFLDEIDAVGRRRQNDIPGSGVESAQTLNAILVEMDGFTSDDNVIVLAATNRPDVLDPALLRPGRFDRRIYVDLPDMHGREEILKVHVKGVKLGDDIDVAVIARGTPAFSGADLESLVNEAALIAVMREKDSVDMECFEESRDKVRFGKEKRSRKMDDQDRKMTAFHEAGHALLMCLLPHATPLHKVTIIPRGRALGSTMQLPEKDEYHFSKRQVIGEVTVFLGGRAAEELFLEDIGTGASNDLENSTKLVREMICEWGMSKEIGLIHYGESKRSADGFYFAKPFSEDIAKRIDTEIRRVVDECYAEALRLLKENEKDVRLIVDGLMEFEILSKDEVTRIIDDGSLDAVRTERNLKKAAAETKVDKIEKSEEEPTTVPTPDDIPLGPLPEGA